MKLKFVSALLTAALMLIIPLYAFTFGEQDTPSAQTSSASKDILYSKAKKADFYDSFKVLNSKTKQISTVSSHDYLIGVLAAEMPISFEEEALKAQAVAAYTFACRRRDNSKNDYDISDDYNIDQSYLSLSELNEKWGENAGQNIEKLAKVVESVEGIMLTYDGIAALTVYHAISSGRTNPCKDVWGGDLPYLTAVDSVGDKTAGGYLSTASFTPDQLCNALGVKSDGNSDAAGWIRNLEKNDSGRVMKLSVCNTDMTGAQISKALSLRSSSFDVSFQDGSFIFTVYGSGHGVGMSQHGANYMAKQGSSFEEILNWYYPGTVLKKAKE